MKQEEYEEYDEFDKKLFEYFAKERAKEEVPLSTHIAIQTAFDKERKHVSKVPSSLRKVAVVLVTFTVFFSSFTFAENFWQKINLIFTNSNEGINKAVENGYVQDIDMDFVECNGVKVKADHILMDDKNLNISLVYQYAGDMKDIKAIVLEDVLITDEQENILAYLTENSERDKMKNKSIGKYLNRYSEQAKIENEIKESIFVSTQDNNFPNSKEITIHSRYVHIETEKEYIDIEGEWKFQIGLDTIFEQRKGIKYGIAEGARIKNSNIEVNDTSMKVELAIKDMEFKENLVLDKLILKNNEKTYYSDKVNIEKIEDNCIKISTIFNITKYEVKEEYELIIKDNVNEEIVIKLKKETS